MLLSAVVCDCIAGKEPRCFFQMLTLTITLMLQVNTLIMTAIYSPYAPWTSDDPFFAIPFVIHARFIILELNEKGFWLLVEAGDVDWANHDNNIDKSIGAVISGEDAFSVITNWAEQDERWKDTLVIVAADHGHLFTLLEPDALLEQKK